jgi:hypothetical protein
MSITLISQKTETKKKKKKKYDTITEYKSMYTLDPVTSWAQIINSVLSYKRTTLKSQVNTFLHSDKQRLVYITSAQTRAFLKLTVATMGAKTLGIQIRRVRTLSVRTNCAILLYMTKVRSTAFMFLGQ